MDARPRSFLAGDKRAGHLCGGRRAAWFGEARCIRSRRGIGSRAIHSSISEQSLMANSAELLKVPVFAGLPDDQIAWFLSQAQEMSLKAGETYFREGDPAEAMFVILEGQI